MAGGRCVRGSVMQNRASSHGHTWIGYAPAPDRDLREEEERTVRGVFLGPDVEEDRTEVTRLDGAMTYVGDDADRAVFTSGMLQELRRRLREAEVREASGVRLRPTAEDDDADDELELDVDVELDLDLHLDLHLEQVAPRAPVAELEVALAPNSESNLYAGFDDEHPDGVFLATYSRLPVGAPVSLEVHLPAGHRFRTAARVEWVRPPEAAAPGVPAGIGFSMCELDEAARSLVRSFARQRKPLFYVA